MRTVANYAVLAVLSVSILAQAPPPPPPAAPSIAAHPAAAAPTKFEIADVHLTPPFRVPFYSGAFLSGDRYIIRQATMAHLVGTAWNLQPRFIGSGPSWIRWDRYDITAKVPPGTTLDTARIMLKNLLAERFKLVAHPGDVQVPAYVLKVANGNPIVKLSTSTEEGSCSPKYPNGPVSGNSIPVFDLDCHATSMESLANTIGAVDVRDYIPYLTPVVNDTRLKGLYDLELKWTPRNFLPQAGASGVTLFEALETLGLSLEFRKTPRAGIVIDSVNREPTPNAPDLASVMPPLPPPQFEVATIKPSDPNAQRGGCGFTGDEFNFQGISLRDLIEWAWDLDDSYDGLLVAPKWLDSDHIDIHAKVATSDLGNNSMGRNNFMNPDDFRPMLRALLIERFQIKYHMEERPIDTYTLLADHPKLTPADPKEYTACESFPGNDGKDLRETNIMLDSIQSCFNTSMDQFAGQLHRIAPDYFYYPVVDETGIKGAWDFTLVWSSARLAQVRGPGMQQPAQEGVQAVGDPNGAVSLFDAIRKQLGLKIVKQKHVEPVLVIDEINKKPTEN